MGWPSFRLDQVAEVAAGNPAPQEPSDFADDGSLFIRMQDVGRWHHTSNLTASTDRVSADAISKHRLRLFTAGSVLIPKSGASVNLNHRAMLGCDAYVVSHLAVIVPDRRKLLPEYLYLWSLSYDPRSQAQTTSLPSLPLSLIKVATIPVPPLPEQRRIVDLLFRAEVIVHLRREAEKKAAELIPALFLDMFGDPVTNPKGWPVEKLDSVAQIISGATKGRRFDPSEAIELPYMRVANVKDGHLDLTDIKTISVKRGEVEKYRLLPGDLLMTEGGDPDKLGRGALWSGEIETCLHQNHIFKVRADRSRLIPEYLCELVSSRYGKTYFLRVAKKTTGIATINRTQLGGFPVVVPPLGRQEEFGEKLGAVRSIQSQQSAATAKAKATFNALLAGTFHN